jgi:predicted amidophosphoribosyltransferase
LVPELGGAQPVRLSVRSLFGALAVQLLFTAVGARFMRSCAGCPRWFSPARRPRGNEKSWCPTCKRAGKDHAAASATFREREAADPHRPKLRRGRRVLGEGPSTPGEPPRWS